MMQGPGGAQFADDQYQMGGPEAAWGEEFGAQQMGLPGPGPQQQWAAEFAQMHGHPPPPEAWAQEFHGQMQGGPQQWGEQFHQMHGPQAWGNEFVQQHPGPQQFEQAWQEGKPEAVGEEWANEFQEEQQRPLPHERDLDEASTRQLTAQVVKSLANDPKMRQSQFVDFIAKMSTGEIEFQDGEVVYNDGPQAQLPGAVHPSELQGNANEWAAEFATAADQAEVEDWAEEYGDQAWAQEFQQNMGPMGPMGMGPMAGGPLSAGPNTWANEFAEQKPAVPEAEQWADEFTDGDALGLNPNPITGEASLKHKFTLPNPYADDESPYETGMELYRQGDFQNAVFAFEAELQRNGENADAKFQLASAIILGQV